MTGKGKDPKDPKDSVKPEPAPKKQNLPVEKSGDKPKTAPPKDSVPPALTTSPKPKKEQNSSSPLGIVLFVLVILAVGIGGGGYYLFQEQMKFQNQTLAKLSQLEAQLSALDTEADQTRQNKQSIDTLNQEIQQFKTEMDTTLKTHQSSLATLDEDVMRLKEKVRTKTVAPPVPLPGTEDTSTEPEPLPGELSLENPGESEVVPENGETEENSPEQKSQKFVEWMENFFRAIWNWFAGLFS